MQFEAKVLPSSNFQRMVNKNPHMKYPFSISVPVLDPAKGLKNKIVLIAAMSILKTPKINILY